MGFHLLHVMNTSVIDNLWAEIKALQQVESRECLFVCFHHLHK